MSTLVQTQQPTIQAGKQRQVQCTPHLRGRWRFHISYEDFEMLCGGALAETETERTRARANADALRVFEVATNDLIKRLRHFDGIPVDHLPHEDDLWLSDISLRDLEALTRCAHGKSTYAYCVSERAQGGKVRTLIELGFLRKRYIARPGNYSRVGTPRTTIYLDNQGEPFIIVDEQGNYSVQGELCSAFEDGYSNIEAQYLYEIDAINAALAALDGLAPPTPLPRWQSLQRTKKSAGRDDESMPGEEERIEPARRDVMSRLGTREARDSFDFQNNTVDPALSLENSKKSQSVAEIAELRRAPWTAETLIALAVHHLVIPADDGSEEWQRNWLGPAQWLIEQTIDLDPSRAWEVIERAICAMISGPTWHARKASRPFTAATLTLRHVVGEKKATQALDGHNWRSTADALRKEPWAVDVHIDYDGPPFFAETSQAAQAGDAAQSYAQGYGPAASSCEDESQSTQGTANVVEVVAQASQIDERATKPLRSEDAPECEGVAQSEQGSGEVTQGIAQPIRRTRGMRTKYAAERLAATIYAAHPLLTVQVFELAIGHVASIATAQDQWYDFAHPDDYHAATAQTLAAIDAAVAYGKQRQAAMSNDSQGPPGDAMEASE